MWFTAFAMAGVLWLLINLQMANNHENAVATMLIGPAEELNDNFRSYLSINPLNEDLRFNLHRFKDQKINTNPLPMVRLEQIWATK